MKRNRDKLDKKRIFEGFAQQIVASSVLFFTGNGSFIPGAAYVLSGERGGGRVNIIEVLARTSVADNFLRPWNFIKRNLVVFMSVLGVMGENL